jgi:thiamine-monophosphate kinase
VGEFELLSKIRERLAGPEPPDARVAVWIGDDAAVTTPGGATVTSVDAVVEDVHFRRSTAPLRSIGHKALAAALSDLAAMGAAPGEAYVVLGVPEDLDTDGCLELCDGIAAHAAETGTVLAGGDLTRSPVLSLTVTAVGHLQRADDAVLRSGAQPDQVVVLTGELGGASAGRLLLEDPQLAGGLDAAVADRLRRRQLEPRPRLAEGRALAAAGASAMIDLSDGLGGDAGHVATASGVRIEIDLELLPLQAGVAEVARAGGLDGIELAVTKGEDYELLAVLAADAVPVAKRTIEEAGGRLTEVGRTLPGTGVALRRRDGPDLEPRGHDQLADRDRA